MLDTHFMYSSQELVILLWTYFSTTFNLYLTSCLSWWDIPGDKFENVRNVVLNTTTSTRTALEFNPLDLSLVCLLPFSPSYTITHFDCVSAGVVVCLDPSGQRVPGNLQLGNWAHHKAEHGQRTAASNCHEAGRRWPHMDRPPKGGSASVERFQSEGPLPLTALLQLRCQV